MYRHISLCNLPNTLFFLKKTSTTEIKFFKACFLFLKIKKRKQNKTKFSLISFLVYLNKNLEVNPSKTIVVIIEASHFFFLAN